MFLFQDWDDANKKIVTSCDNDDPYPVMFFIT
jgi:hypothetical protein